MYRVGQSVVIKSRQEIDKTLIKYKGYMVKKYGCNETGISYGFAHFKEEMYKYCGQAAYVVRRYGYNNQLMLLSMDKQKFSWVDEWAEPAVIDNREVRA